MYPIFDTQVVTKWYVFWGRNIISIKVSWSPNQKIVIMRYKVIDAKSQYFGKVLDFSSCANISDLGGVLLKTEKNKVSLFKFSEVEML